jgi:hypothetical protein
MFMAGVANTAMAFGFASLAERRRKGRKGKSGA